MSLISFGKLSSWGFSCLSLELGSFQWLAMVPLRRAVKYLASFVANVPRPSSKYSEEYTIRASILALASVGSPGTAN